MNAYTNPDKLSYLNSTGLSRAGTMFDGKTPRPGLTSRIAAFFRALAEYPRRQAVLDELSLLSDRELADIGLSRGDLSRVFDPAFAAQREASAHGFAG